MGTLRIDVLGTDFSIASKEDEHYLVTLLENYKAMVRIIEKNDVDPGAGRHARSTPSDSLKTAILAGIMLCDELYKEKQKSARAHEFDSQKNPELTEVERMTLQMIDKIDKALL
jgi:cell division protein ZapA